MSAPNPMAEDVKRPDPPFWRGALGGAVGGLLWLVVIPGFRNNLDNPYFVFALFYAVLFVIIPSGFVGMLAGLILWRLSKSRGGGLGVVERLSLGVILSVAMTALIAAALYLIMMSNNHEPKLWLSHKGYIFLWGAMVGACSGILIRDHGPVENGGRSVAKHADE